MSEQDDNAPQEPPLERRDLPKWNRAKVPRSNPATDDIDAFTASVVDVGKAAHKRAYLVIAALIGVGAVVAGIVAAVHHMRQGRAEATRTVAEAAAWIARGRVREGSDEPRPQLKHVANDPSVEDEAELVQTTTAALAAAQGLKGQPHQLAALLDAAHSIAVGDAAQAKAAYEAFLQANPDHPLAFAAHEGIMVASEMLEDAQAALAYVEAHTPEKGAFYRDQFLWHKGRLLEALARNDDAVEAYVGYAEEFPFDKSSMAQDQVQARLRVLAPARLEALNAVPEAAAEPEVPAEPEAATANDAAATGN